MALSASQARFLQLTAHLSNRQYEAQQITQAKMANASMLEAKALEWSNGMNVQNLYYSPDGSGSASEDLQRLSYHLVTSSEEDGGLGMQIRDSYGRKVVPALPDPMPEGETVENYAVEPYCGQSAYFETNLKTGNWFIQKQTSDGWVDESIAASNFIYQGIDSGDYAIALADYDAEVEKLHKRDKEYDLRLQQIKTECDTIHDQIESLKKVIDKNIDETFKSFG